MSRYEDFIKMYGRTPHTRLSWDQAEVGTQESTYLRIDFRGGKMHGPQGRLSRGVRYAEIGYEEFHCAVEIISKLFIKITQSRDGLLGVDFYLQTGIRS